MKVGARAALLFISLFIISSHAFLLSLALQRLIPFAFREGIADRRGCKKCAVSRRKAGSHCRALRWKFSKRYPLSERVCATMLADTGGFEGKAHKYAWRSFIRERVCPLGNVINILSVARRYLAESSRVRLAHQFFFLFFSSFPFIIPGASE